VKFTAKVLLLKKNSGNGTQKQFLFPSRLLISFRVESSCRWLLQSNVAVWALPGTKLAITEKRLYILLPFHLLIQLVGTGETY